MLCVGDATCEGDCHPALPNCGLSLALPGPCEISTLGSKVCGGPYPVGCDVGLTPPLPFVLLKGEGVAGAGFAACPSPRRCAGRELLVRYCRLLMPASSVLGDIERFLWLGDGVETGDPKADPCSPSDRAFVRAVAPRASASAVALAASSIVPVWWFWCLVNVVRRVKVFWQSAKGHL